jgi:hypothetical protein
MTEKVIVITTDNEISIQELEVVNGLILDGLQKIVGGYIETVRPMNLEHPLMFVCNEDGIAKELPLNLVGSILYGAHQHGCPILGNIAIVQQGWRDGEPDIVGLPNNIIQHVYDQFIEKYPVLVSNQPEKGASKEVH